LPGEHRRYRISVLRDPQSRGGSVQLLDKVREGDELAISAPRNHFGLHTGPDRSLLFAGGIGITPILCMAQQLAQEGRPFELQINGTGQVIRVAADQSAAQALLDAGFPLSLSCEQGVCGTCMTKVVAGAPDHRDLYLTDAEHDRNDCFTPCCSRSRTPRLV